MTYPHNHKWIWRASALIVVVLFAAIILAIRLPRNLSALDSDPLLTSDKEVLPKSISTSAPTTFYHDFGNVLSDSKQRHVFKVVNRSDATWTISQIKTSCRCTVAKLSSTVVRPGGRLALPVTLNVGVDDGGKSVQQSVRMLCENPAHNLLFHLSAKVHDPITVRPDIQQVGLTVDETEDAELVIENYSDVDWADVVVSSPKNRRASALIAGLRTARQVSGIQSFPRQVWIATIQVDSHDVPHGRYEHALEVVARRTDGKSERKTIMFHLEIRPEVRAVPQSLVFLPAVPTSDSSAKTIHLVYAKANLVPDERLIKYSHDLPIDLEMSFSRQGPNTTLAIIHALPNSSANGTVKGTISIVLPTPVSRTLSVPVTLLAHSPK